ncbi:MAG: tetratricopeptide repeat protein [Nitrospinota bacterium]|nr:tetratricopeptide repeat protein [Nitrospinota bacterium]
MIRVIVDVCSKWSAVTAAQYSPTRRLIAVPEMLKNVVSNYCWLILFAFVLAGPATSLTWAADSSSFKEGLQAFRSKDYPRAKISFLKSVQEEPNNALTHYYLGLTHNRLDSHGDALNAFQRARALDPSLPGLRLSLGLSYFKMDLYEQALPELEKAREEEPDNGTIYFFLGRVRQELRQYEASNLDFENAARLDADFKQQSQYYIAVNYFRQGKLPEAKTVFRQTIAISPDSPMAKSARDYLDAFHTSRRQDKKIWYQVGMGWKYDDNVTSSIQDVNTRDGDAAFTFELGGGYRFAEKRQFYVEATYDLYQSVFFDLDEFNLQSHSLGISANKTKGPWDFGLDYILNYNFLGGDSFLVTHSFIGSAGLSWNTRNFTRFSYMLQPRNFLQSVNDPRDGLDNQLSLDHFVFTSDGKKHFQFGYRFIDEIAEGDRFDYVGHSLTLAVKVPTRYEGNLKLRYSYLHKDFKNITPSIGAERWDQRHTFQIAWTRMFLKNLEFKADFQHIENISNFPVVDYSENIIAFNGLFLF